MRRAVALSGLLAALVLGAPTGSAAQQVGVIQSDVLLIDPERLLLQSQYGQSLQRGLQAERDELIADNERVAAELEAEEQALTGLRPTLPSAEFRELADAFDQKVEELRLDSERRSRELERKRDLVQSQFMRVVRPVLTKLLDEANAMVMLDARSVMLHAGAADITDLAIKRVDARIGSGPAQPGLAPPEDAPLPEK